MTAPQVEDFDGDDLDRSRWVTSYLPHWSSRAESRATYAVEASVLRLSIPVDQDLWCPRTHEPALRVSAVASGLFAGEVGSSVGQQPFRDGQVVLEAQPEHRGWLLGHGRLTVRARFDLSPRSMASVWLTGFEDEPHRSGEVCVFEVFGDTITGGASPTAAVGAGLHQFRDPALDEDFFTTDAPLVPSAWHEFTVDMGPDGCHWCVDGRPLRVSGPAPQYPLQIFIGVFDFPERPGPHEHEPWLEVDRITFLPIG